MKESLFFNSRKRRLPLKLPDRCKVELSEIYYTSDLPFSAQNFQTHLLPHVLCKRMHGSKSQRLMMISMHSLYILARMVYSPCSATLLPQVMKNKNLSTIDTKQAKNNSHLKAQWQCCIGNVVGDKQISTAFFRWGNEWLQRFPFWISLAISSVVLYSAKKQLFMDSGRCWVSLTSHLNFHMLIRFFNVPKWPWAFCIESANGDKSQ